MIRLTLLALLPQLDGILLMVGRAGLARPPAPPTSNVVDVK